MTAVLDTPVIDTDTLWLLDDIGPRVEGGTYRHATSGTYTVTEICSYGHDGMPWSITVRWHDAAETTTHCTPWRSERDSVLTSAGSN